MPSDHCTDDTERCESKFRAKMASKGTSLYQEKKLVDGRVAIKSGNTEHYHLLYETASNRLKPLCGTTAAFDLLVYSTLSPKLSSLEPCGHCLRVKRSRYTDTEL